MKLYKTFAECKLAHPECDVYRGSKCGCFSIVPNQGYYEKCDPADYLMSVYSFLSKGFELAGGDIYIGVGGDVIEVDSLNPPSNLNRRWPCDKGRYILKAKALESSPIQHLEQQRAKARFDASIDATLAERGSRYGEFEDGAAIMQSLKDVMQSTDGWTRLSPSQREALEMIQHKIGRILNGDPNYADSWVDIAGYAKLISDNLEEK
jgi:hypothetical protein